MSKKISAIFLSLFVVGVLSISCSNKDTTGAGSAISKTINMEYAGIWGSSSKSDSVEIDMNGNIYEYKNSSRGAKGEIIEANDPNYKIKIYGREFTITFTDVNNATVNIDGQNVTYTKSTGIAEYNDNTYVSIETFDYDNDKVYLWVSVKDGKVAINHDAGNETAPKLTHFTVAGYGTDYSFSIVFDLVVGTLKFAPDGSSVTVRFTKQLISYQSMLNIDIVCNKKQ